MYNALKYEQVQKLNELNKIREDHQRNIEYMQTKIMEKERELQSCAQKMDELCKTREAAHALCDKQEEKKLCFISQ